LWVCDSDPNDAWLMLVSAVEVAAEEWRSAAADDEPEMLLRTLKPKWVRRLDQTGDATLVKDMAAEWAKLLKSEDRFTKFLIAHLPDPPGRRPAADFQVPWSKTNIRRVLSLVYEHRSRALHGGIPFPLPMCASPLSTLAWEAPSERPGAGAHHEAGGTWVAEDMPIHLHTFLHLVRGALLKWWQTLAPTSPTA
jgi:hypothetical protein